MDNLIKLIIINPASKHVFPSEVTNSLRTLQGIVGGSIEMVVSLPRNDYIYANANGIFKQEHYWWTLLGHPALFTGPGFVIQVNRFGKFTEPKVSPESIRKWVTFLSIDEARAKWDEYQAALRARAEAAGDGRDVRVIFAESEFPG